MKKSLVLLMAMAMAGLFLAAAQAQVNVTGDWTLTVTTPRGDRVNDVTFTQDGEKLTVVMKGQRGESKGEGTIKGQDISWTITRQTPQGDMTSTYKGKVTDDKTMSGEAVMSQGTMAWKATKKAS